MLNQPVQYTDYDGVNRTATLRFNLTRMEVIENIDLRKHLQEAESIIETASHEMTQEEIVVVLGLVKVLVKAAYGVKVDDRFVKTEKIWTEFTERAVYDEFLYQIFDGTIDPNAFINGLLPRVLREEMAKQDMPAKYPQLREVSEDLTPADVPTGQPRPDAVEKYVRGVVDETPIAPEPADDRPQWLIDQREPTEAEMRVATKEQMFEAFRLRSNR